MSAGRQLREACQLTLLLKCRRRRSALVMSILVPWTAFGGWLSPEIHMVISAIAHLGRAEDRQVLLHLTISLSSRQTAHRRLSGAHRDRSQSHRQWLAVTAPAGRAYAVERVRPTCRAAPRCCQTKQVPKKGVEGRRREARRRPKKLRFISRGQKALAHPSLLPLKGAPGAWGIWYLRPFRSTVHTHAAARKKGRTFTLPPPYGYAGCIYGSGAS